MKTSCAVHSIGAPVGPVHVLPLPCNACARDLSSLVVLLPNAERAGAPHVRMDRVRCCFHIIDDLRKMICSATAPWRQTHECSEGFEALLRLFCLWNIPANHTECIHASGHLHRSLCFPRAVVHCHLHSFSLVHVDSACRWRLKTRARPHVVLSDHNGAFKEAEKHVNGLFEPQVLEMSTAVYGASVEVVLACTGEAVAGDCGRFVRF